MPLSEHMQQDLVVGLYERGEGLEPAKRILDIGTSKTLKSGIWSPYLVNFRPALSFDAESSVSIENQVRTRDLLLVAMGVEVNHVGENEEFFHVFGPPEAGTPLATAVAVKIGRSLLWQRVIPKKGYGTHQTLEGVFMLDQAVVEADDVVTGGDTKKEGKELLEANGLRVVGVAVGFNREQGGQEAVERMGLKFGAALGAVASFGYLRDAKKITRSEHDYLVEYTLNPETPREEPANHPWKS